MMKVNLFLVLALLVLGGCREKRETAEPVALTGAHSCELDGMIVANYPGPKSQMLRKDGSRAFYCDCKEIFTEILDPIRSHKIRQVFFQVMDESSWQSHPDGWAPGANLYFVGGSSRKGAMGPTLVPFQDSTTAATFAEQYGGSIYRFSEIDADVMSALKAQGMSEM